MQVGISIKDQNGELKDMDDILDEMGSKWKTLNKDQQLALAQTVAGTRQYNQLVALMDNWDFMTKNLETASKATGELNKQQDTYMESMQAHLENLRTAKDSLQMNLFESDSFIEAIDLLTKGTKLLDTFVQSIGGGGNSLLLLGSIATKVFDKQIASGLGKTIKSFSTFRAQAQKAQAEALIAAQYGREAPDDKTAQTMVAMKQRQLEVSDYMSVEEIQASNDIINQVNEIGKLVDEWEKAKAAAEAYVKSIEGLEDFNGDFSDISDLNNIEDAFEKNKGKREEALELLEIEDLSKEDLNYIYRTFSENVKGVPADVFKKFEEQNKKVTTDDTTGKENKKELNELKKILHEIIEASEDADENLKEVIEGDSNTNGGGKTADLEEKMEGLNKDQEKILDTHKFEEKIEQLTQYTSAVTSAAFAVQSFLNLGSIWEDDTLSTGEKIVQTIMALASAITGLIPIFTIVRSAYSKIKKETAASTISTRIFSKAVDDNSDEMRENAIASNAAANAIDNYGKKAAGAGVAAKVGEGASSAGASAAGAGVAAKVGAGAGAGAGGTAGAGAGAGGAAAGAGIGLATVGWIVAAVAALGLVAYAIYDVATAEKQAYEHAKALAEETSEQFKIATYEAEQFRQTVSDYSDARKAIDELTEGTDEYTKAVEEANKKAKDLIETYGLFDNFHYENGVMTIDEEALADIQKQKDDRANQLEMTMYGAKAATTGYESKQIANDLRKNHSVTVGTNARGGSKRASTEDWQAVIDAVKEYQDNPEKIGNEIIDAKAREAAKDENGNFDQAKYDKFIADAADGPIKITTSDILNNAGLSEAFSEYEKEIYKAIDAQRELTAANEFYTDELRKNAIKENEEVDKKAREAATDEEGNFNQAKYDAFVAAVAQGAEINDEKDGKDDLQEAINKIDVSNIKSNAALNTRLTSLETKYGENFDAEKYGSIERDKDLALTYAETVLGMDRSTLDYKGDIGKGTIITEDGQKIEHSDEFYRQAIARQAEIDALTADWTAKQKDNLENASNAVTSISQNGGQLNEIAGISDKVDIAGAIINNISNGNFDNMDLSSVMSQMSKEQVEKLQGLDNEELLTSLGFTDATIAQLQALGYEGGEDFCEQFQAALDNYDLSAYLANELANTEEMQTNMETAINDMMSGKLTSENADEHEGYQAMLSQLDELTEKYPELTASAAAFSEQGLIGSQTWSEAAQQIQDKLNEIKLDNLAQAANEVYDELTAISEASKDFDMVDLLLNDDDFQDQIDELLDANYAIEVEVHAQAEQAFEDFEKATEDIAKQAAKIGENFVVSASDIRELNNAFPGIIQGMEAVGDGTVKLNEEIAQSAIDAANAEIAANAESTVSQLENQAKILRGRQATYRSMYEAALALSNSEGDIAQHNATIKAGFDELEATNDKIASDTEMENAKLVADDSNVNAGIMASNWNSAYESAANDAIAFAETAKSAAAVAESGEGTVTKGDFSVSYSGSAGKSSEAAKTAELQQAYESGNADMAEFAMQLKAAMESSGKLANDIEGMVAEAKATTVESLNSLNNTGKGRGGGGGSKEKEAEYMELLSEEADRYHDIDIEIKQIEKDLSRLQKEQDKLTGTKLAENLAKQLAYLDKQNKAYAEKLSLMRQERDEMANILAAQGVKFNEDGTISNYKAIFEAKQAEVNDLITQYNNMTAAEQESVKDQVEQAKNDFKEFTAELENYDKIVSESLPGLEDQIQDTLHQQIELQIQQVEIEIEAKLDIIQLEKDWNSFVLKFRDEMDEDSPLFKAAEAISSIHIDLDPDGTFNTLLDDLASTTSEVEKLFNGEDSIFSASTDISKLTNNSSDISSMSAEDRAVAAEDLEQDVKDLQDAMYNFDDAMKAINEAFVKGVNNLDEAYQKQIEIFDYYSKQSTHDMKMVELLYGDKAYDKMDAYYKEQVTQSKKSVKLYEEEQKVWYDLMMHAKSIGDNDAYELYKEKWMSATEDLNTSIETWAENITNEYKNVISSILQTLEDELTNNLGFSELNKELDLVTKTADLFLDEINEAYALQDLEWKWTDAINNTDSISGQKELNKLMDEQLKKLREKGKLSEYDVQRAEKEYEIALKQIALKEAQQNKSTMRLKRDASGNYSYQYVADEDAIGDAERDLAAAKNDLYNFDKDNYQKNLQDMVTAYQEFQNDISEISTNANLSAEEKQRLLEERQRQYYEYIGGLQELNATARVNLQESASMEISSLFTEEEAIANGVTTRTGEIIMDTLVPTWNGGVQQMIDKLSSEGGLESTFGAAIDNIVIKAEDYENKLSEIGEKSDEVSEKNREMQEQFEEDAEQSKEAMQDELDKLIDIRDELKTIEGQWGAVKKATLDAISEANEYLKKLKEISKVDPPKITSSSGSTSATQNSSTLTPSASNTAQGINGGNTGSKSQSAKSPYDNKKLILNSSPNGIGGDSGGIKWPGANTYIEINGGKDGFNKLKNKYKNLGALVYAADGVTKLDTGGYTGEWGPEGKMAMLHEKEIVLNKDDTANLLKAIQLIREQSSNMKEDISNKAEINIKDIIKSYEDEMKKYYNQYNSISEAFGDIIKSEMEESKNKISNIIENSNIKNMNTNENDNTIQQNVQITATFEDVRTAQEIEKALDNLVNRASQFANRNTR